MSARGIDTQKVGDVTMVRPPFECPPEAKDESAPYDRRTARGYKVSRTHSVKKDHDTERPLDEVIAWV